MVMHIEVAGGIAVIGEIRLLEDRDNAKNRGAGRLLGICSALDGAAEEHDQEDRSEPEKEREYGCRHDVHPQPRRDRRRRHERWIKWSYVRGVDAAVHAIGQIRRRESCAEDVVAILHALLLAHE